MRPVMVTVALLAVGLMLQWVPAPGVGEQFRAFAPGALNLGALGVAPIVAAFLGVELVALVVPRWRAWRIDAGGRERLNAYSRRLALVIAALQSWGMATWLRSLENNELLQGEGVASEPVLAGVAWTGAVALYLLLAHWISRYGVGCAGGTLVVPTALHSPDEHMPEQPAPARPSRGRHSPALSTAGS